MTKLSEILGALMSDFATARHLADIQTVRLAREYQADPVLRDMSVPRLRMPEVTVEMPFLYAARFESQPSRLPGSAAPSPPSSPTDSFIKTAEAALQRLSETDQAGAGDSRSKLAAVDVMVSAAELREHAGSDGVFLSKLKIKFRDESVELSHSKPGSRGDGDFRLIPE